MAAVDWFYYWILGLSYRCLIIWNTILGISTHYLFLFQFQLEEHMWVPKSPLGLSVTRCFLGRMAGGLIFTSSYHLISKE